MDRSRFAIASRMTAVGIAAVDCGILVQLATSFAGGYLLALALQIGLFVMLRGTGRMRRFWIGFESIGLACLIAYVVCCSFFNGLILQWPSVLYQSYRSGLSNWSPEVVEWLLTHIYIVDPRGNLTVLQKLLVLEIPFGLPMLVLAAIGGGISASFGSRSKTGKRGSAQEPGLRSVANDGETARAISDDVRGEIRPECDQNSSALRNHRGLPSFDRDRWEPSPFVQVRPEVLGG